VARWGLLFALVACSKAAPALVIPNTTGALKIDGELGEADWNDRALRHGFTSANGEASRPFSEVRWLHDAKNLYVGLYAADENIQSRDFFELTLGQLVLHADATGKITPAVAGLTSAIDSDGTLDDPSNDDEEWVYEIVIPLPATGLATGAELVRAARCDTPKDGIVRCGAWSGRVELE
jgi:hypothetical protein